MGWVQLDGDVAVAPRVRMPRPIEPVDGNDLVEDGLLALTEVDVTAQVLQLDGVDELVIESSNVSGVSFEGDSHPNVRMVASSLTGCDLSGLRVEAIEACEISGTKLGGTDFSDARVRDTVFRQCLLRYTNLRMATIERVRFEGCTFTEVDAYAATLADIAFPESTLAEVGIDRAVAERVDLRDAETLDLRGLGRLDGFVVRDAQLHWLMAGMALASGLDIEVEENER